MRRGAACLVAVIALFGVPRAAARTPPPAPSPAAPVTPPAPQTAVPVTPALRLSGPAVRAAGVAIALHGRGAVPLTNVEPQRLVDGQRWGDDQDEGRGGGRQRELLLRPRSAAPALALDAGATA